MCVCLDQQARSPFGLFLLLFSILCSFVGSALCFRCHADRILTSPHSMAEETKAGAGVKGPISHCLQCKGESDDYKSQLFVLPVDGVLHAMCRLCFCGYECWNCGILSKAVALTPEGNMVCKPCLPLPFKHLRNGSVYPELKYTFGPDE